MSGVALLATCTRFVPTEQTGLRVLVYNIHAGKDAAGVDNLTRVADLVRATNTDVVLLQEVDRRTRRSGSVDQLARLTALTGMHGAFGKTLDYDGGEYGVALLSRWPIARDALTPLPVDPPQQRAGGSYEPRGAQVVALRLAGHERTFINTHLDPSRDDHYRRQETRVVLGLARAEPGLVAVGGDFNSTPESAVQTEIANGGLRDAWLVCGRGDGFTYPADRPSKRIDYLYLAPGWSCSSAEVLVTTASDHRPLLVRLSATGHRR